MRHGFEKLLRGCSNIVLLGEAGCGKSEIAANLAMKAAGFYPTDLFDLDQTKALFRVRDIKKRLDICGVHTYFSEQFYDAPTETGGVQSSLSDCGRISILDVGGGSSGARLIGRYSAQLNQPDTRILYIINCYRPWSGTLKHIDETLSAILSAARLNNICFIANPNLGRETDEKSVRQGLQKTVRLLTPYACIEGMCAKRELCSRLDDTGLPLLPMELYMNCVWNKNEQ